MALACIVPALLAPAASAQSYGPPAPTPAPEKEVRLALPADPLYEEGTRALDEGLPQVAAYKLRAFLQFNPAPAPRRAAVLALVRALLAESDAPGALALLDAEHPPSSPVPAAAAEDTETVFWRAQTQAALGRWQEALATYARTAATPPPVPPGLHACARFGEGEAFFALGRSTEAAGIFKALGGDPLLGERARLRYAEIELDRWHLKPDSAHLKEAAAILLDAHAGGTPTPASSSPDVAGSGTLLAKERAYLLGRLRLAQRQPALAEGIFKAALSHPGGLSERLMVDNYWGWARACLDEDQLDRAQDALESLVERYPNSAFLALTFTWLEALYRRGPAPDFSVLRRWSDDANEPGREALARLSLARLETHAGHTDRAAEILIGFEDSFPDHPLRVRALLDLAALRLQLGQVDPAREALEHARRLAAGGTETPPTIAVGFVTEKAPAGTEWRTEIEALDARISLAQHDNVHAAERFGALAERLGTEPPAEAAAFDAVLGWLRAADMDRFAEAGRAFAERFPRSPLRAEFPLEEGLARASQTPPGDDAARRRAADCLRAFLAADPGHPRAPEAHLALAELAFTQSSPDLDGARRELDAPDLRLVANPEDAAARDRAEYLAIWLADEPGPARDPDRAVALAKAFLTAHADSPLAAEVRMKLGEIYFQRADYPDAQTQLELLSRNAPNSPLAEPALYLAGMSARLSMSAAGLDNAVDLFEQAARRGGPFKLPARLQQAEVQNQLDRGRDALILYDGVLTATGGGTLSDADLESRCAALCGRGQTLLGMAGGPRGGPQEYRDAVAAFDQLAANTPGASLLWRRQALTLKGHALEKLGDPDAALSAYDDALNAADPPSAGEPNAPEWTWFYRAGSDAARLLESRSQWPQAVAIYKKLAAADGPMKSEFENLLQRRQLEHFIWPE